MRLLLRSGGGENAAITVKPKSGGGTENGTSFALAPCLAYQARHASRPFRAAAVCSYGADHGEIFFNWESIHRDNQHWPAALLLVACSSVGVNLDDVAL